MIKNKQTYNCYFIATVVKLNGGVDQVELNELIQQRADYSREDAFGLIADTLRWSLIWFDDQDKKLKLSANIYTRWQVAFGGSADEIAAILSQSWPLFKYKRELSTQEKKVLDKLVLRGNFRKIIKAKKIEKDC